MSNIPMEMILERAKFLFCVEEDSEWRIDPPWTTPLRRSIRAMLLLRSNTESYRIIDRSLESDGTTRFQTDPCRLT